MDIPLQITFKGLAHSDELEADIRGRAAALERFHPHLHSCRVVVEVPDRHKRHGRRFQVRLDLKVPGTELAVTHQDAEDAPAALRDAFAAAVRQLEDHARRVRGDVKPHA
jgi:ribosome-associated translation inhibitor RaiA